MPLGIWLCAPTYEEEAGLPALAHGLSRSLIARAAEEFSRPGDTVLATGLDAARVGAVMAARAGRRLAATGTQGDRPGVGVLDPAPRSLGLILAVELPVPAVSADGELYVTWAQLLRPGGILAVITTNPAGVDDFAHHTAAVARAAQHAGLTFLQHVVAVLAHVEGDRMLVADPPHPGARHDVHVPAHTDLLAFTKPQGPKA